MEVPQDLTITVMWPLSKSKKNVQEISLEMVWKLDLIIILFALFI
jgi:hypothetical protein